MTLKNFPYPLSSSREHAAFNSRGGRAGGGSVRVRARERTWPAPAVLSFSPTDRQRPLESSVRPSVRPSIRPRALGSASHFQQQQQQQRREPEKNLPLPVEGGTNSLSSLPPPPPPPPPPSPQRTTTARSSRTKRGGQQLYLHAAAIRNIIGKKGVYVRKCCHGSWASTCNCGVGPIPWISLGLSEGVAPT